VGLNIFFALSSKTAGNAQWSTTVEPVSGQPDASFPARLKFLIFSLDKKSGLWKNAFMMIEGTAYRATFAPDAGFFSFFYRAVPAAQ